jgi:hypothetical protein
MKSFTTIVAALAATAAASPVVVDVEERQLGGLLCSILEGLPPIGAAFCCESIVSSGGAGVNCTGKSYHEKGALA